MTLEQFMTDSFRICLKELEGSGFVKRLLDRAEELFTLDRGDVESFSLRLRTIISNKVVENIIRDYYTQRGYSVTSEEDLWIARKGEEIRVVYMSNYGDVILVDVWGSLGPNDL